MSLQAEEAGPTVEPRLRWAVLCLGAVLLVARALPTLPTMVDDAYISARYARNLALGHGLVFNAGEPAVEGYSNLLWTVLLALPHGLDLPVRAFATWTGLAFALCCLPGTLRLADALSPRPTRWSLAAVLGVAFSPHLAVACTNGLETALFAAAVVWATWATVASEGRARPWVALGVGTLALIRPEGLAVTAALVGYDLWRWRDRLREGRAWVFPLAALVVLLPVVAWRWQTYSALVPNTVHAKVFDRDLLDLLAANARHLGRPMGPYWPALGGLLTVGLLLGDRRRLARWLAVALAFGIAASALRVYLWMPAARLLVPTLPLAFAVLASAGPSLEGRLRQGWGAVLALAVLVGLAPPALERVGAPDRTFDVLDELGAAGVHIGGQLPPGSTAYVLDAGLFAYALGPHVRIAEAHPRALTRPHPDGADAHFPDYTPENPAVIARVTMVRGAEEFVARDDQLVWSLRTAPYDYLGRVRMHPHRVYDLYVRRDLGVDPLPAELVRGFPARLPGSRVHAADR